MQFKDLSVKVAILLAVMPAVLYSCTGGSHGTGERNEVVLSRDSVAFDSDGQFVSIVSSVDWSIVLEYPGGTAGWARVSPESGSGSMSNIMLLYSENPDSSSRDVSLVVSFSDGEILTLTMRQGGVPGESGNGDGDDGAWPGLVSDEYQYGWLELPEVTPASGTAFVSHIAQVDGHDKRNYSMLYDASARLALWVAYPLCSEYMGSGRTDAWGYDPKIPDRYEPVLERGWSDRDYDRGHQIPSGSRNANTSLNVQTFYFTNMTAQVSEFNQGLWAELENRVRGYCSVCDTLYVVTGPVFDSDDPADWTYTEDNAGNLVAVPDGYFKVLLRYSISPASYYSVGFLYGNRDYGRSNPEREDLRSVSEIESLTGIKFFNNLPQDLSAAVKSQLEPERWGF